MCSQRAFANAHPNPKRNQHTAAQRYLNPHQTADGYFNSFAVSQPDSDRHA
jgi:hypothetical protein